MERQPTDLNVKGKIIKLEDDIKENLGDPELGNGLLDATPKAWSMKEIILSWTLLKWKTYILQKTLLREWEDKPEMGENIAKDTSDKGLLSNIYKELLRLNNKKATQFKSELKI